jgi:hypothetical protein
MGVRKNALCGEKGRIASLTLAMMILVRPNLP